MSEKEKQNKPLVKTPHAEREERILAMWNEQKTFQKSLEKPAPKGDYTFYDGPPFATGLPHYGHILAGTIKDVIPRFKTMQGYRVRRRWGWDCHGLPVENLIEKELGLKSKKDIVDYGVGRFNAVAKQSVMRYADEWRRIIPRLGRWVDMENDYRTMDTTYTESVWWIFKTLYDKGLVREDFKSMNFCPHCETTLSNFEVAQGYKDITDISVYVRFKKTRSQGDMKSGDQRVGPAEARQGDREEGETYFLAWTTTPWTLPGNVALAVNPEIEYVKVKNLGPKVAGKNQSSEKSATGLSVVDSATAKPAQSTGALTEFFILAKSRIEALKGINYEIVAEVKGSDLVGQSYEPMFDYYGKDASLKNRANGWKVYGAEFVTTEDGTGVVHIAPAFGADDYGMLKKYSLPFVQHVATNGTFKAEVTDFVGLSVKPKDTEEDKNAHQKTDVEVIKWLAHHGFLFEKEKLVHSYPHCWRCDTPLLNYATSSWFVEVPKIKDKLVAENNKICWVPPEVGSARFGNWLEGARDWAVSRSRFWGAPIPVWRIENAKKEIRKEGKNEQGKMGQGEAESELVVLGSVEDLKKYSKAKNNYFVMRHGQAENNVKGVLNSVKRDLYHLTEIGKQQVSSSAESLKDKKIDVIFASPFMRAQETAQIVAEKFGIKKDDIHTDDRLHEYSMGIFEGRPQNEIEEQFPPAVRFDKWPEGGEGYTDVKKRMGDVLYEIEKNYTGKNVLIVTHGTPATILLAVARGLDKKQTIQFYNDSAVIKNAEIRSLDFVPLPHNTEYELDLHRPFIDDIELRTADGKKLTRVQDVFDCWFESGSMPYGESHYPFEGDCGRDGFNPKGGVFKKSHGYPADFIAEGLDQTRGWFYSMLVLGVALFGKTPYKKVIVNGLVLAEDGQKMSKSKKNYPDPMTLVDKYGADSMRFYMLGSPVVHGQDLLFSERGVDEVTKKVVNRILNVVSFYEMYAGEKSGSGTVSTGVSESNNTQPRFQNVLDRWIVSRLNETIASVTKGLEAGELDRAERPFLDLVEDLSVWYLRRSRDRFKGDDKADRDSALSATKLVLTETAKLLAPFMPFLAEDIYGRVAGRGDSVHLQSWPTAGKIDIDLLADMQKVRDISSKALEARMTAKINVRQPLASLKVKSSAVWKTKDTKSNTVDQLVELIKDELNVKAVLFGSAVSDEYVLDTDITPALKEEGMFRELARAVQDFRKEKGLSVNDRPVLRIELDARAGDFLKKYTDKLMSTCLLKSVELGSVTAESVDIGGVSVKLEVSKT